ncbi:MAG: DUF1365 domain-containing protein [Planctomycetes bacterium]|nr:DUF1365 domain-containing protein [Planctomycetota bacterium]
MKSAIYEGEVFHRRLEPRPHDFRYRLFLMYLDLDELPRLFAGRWLWSAGAPALAWFRRADYMGAPDTSLREAVLERVERELGRRPAGAVRVLTHLRTFGYVCNPVTFYYCFDPQDELEAIVAEITNTPWGERHAYVLDARASAGTEELRWRFHKDFHVSPFHGMDLDYEWSLHAPGERLDVHMTSLERGRPVFHAGLACRRRAVTGRNLASVLLRYPLLSARIHAAIYWQAARLFLKRAPFHAHPKKLSVPTETSTT